MNQTALHHQMNQLQEIINRMGENSRNVKTWCITIVSALLVFKHNEASFSYLGLFIPVIPFMLLDMYYLDLETVFRKRYNKLVASYANDSLDYKTIYEIKVPGSDEKQFLRHLSSASIWMFYGSLIIIIFIIYALSNDWF